MSFIKDIFEILVYQKEKNEIKININKKNNNNNNKKSINLQVRKTHIKMKIYFKK